MRVCNRGKTTRGKTKAGSNVPELQMLSSLSQGDQGEHPDSPSLLNPLYWEGAESERECNSRMGAADFRLPFSQPLLGVVWCDHQ